MERKINEYITLKLEDDETVIYVNGRKFLQCKKLFINVPYDILPELEDKELSIDELSELTQLKDIEEDDKDIYYEYNITPETEFWAHCSNIQAWAENNYDTTLMHSSLAFPLLEELVNTGDKKAQKYFKEEIVKRFLSGYDGVITYLLELGYLNTFTEEELVVLFTKLPVKDSLHSGLIKYILKVLDVLDTESDEIQKILKNIRSITFEFLHPNYIPSDIDKLYLKKLPSSIDKLSSLEKLEIGDLDGIDLPPSIGSLHSLQSLEIYGCAFYGIRIYKEKEKVIYVGLPNSIGNLKSLHTLNLHDNTLFTLPESIGNLQNLRTLNLSKNSIEYLPETFGNIHNLQELDLSRNSFKLKYLPDSFGSLHNLRILNLSKNSIERLPDSFENLHNLQELDLSTNFLEHLPDSFGNLRSLHTLNLSNTFLQMLPESIGNLQALRILDVSDNDKLMYLPNSITKKKNLQIIT